MRWTKEDLDYLIKNYPSKDVSMKEVLEKLGRTKRAVCHKAVRLGLSRPHISINRPKNLEHRKIYDKKYYENHKSKLYNMKKLRLRNRKLELINILGGKCKKCGYNKCAQALDFHHNKGGKEGVLSKMIMDLSKQKTLKEANKCIILCANCHRELHSKGE